MLMVVLVAIFDSSFCRDVAAAAEEGAPSSSRFAS